MTMIELVAALGLFVVILGALLTIMNTATSLWSTARTQQREQTVGRNLLDLLTDDLQHAVTDAPSNGVPALPPSFILDTRTNQPPSGVQIVLQFARHAKRQTLTPPQPGTPLSLDAVFYTFVDNALFRHAIPLSVDYADPKPLGKLLSDKRPDVVDKPLHENILKYVREPTRNVPPPTSSGTYALLAERIDLLDLPATLPEAFARTPKSRLRAAASTSATGLYTPPQYEYLEADVLPDRIDVALRLHSAEDWATLDRLKSDTSDEAENTRKHLGVFLSKQITFPAQGGSRLPCPSQLLTPPS
jgi:hypothetical protein